MLHFFFRNEAKNAFKLRIDFLLRDVVDVILLLQFFICIYLLILGNENGNNLNISLPLSDYSLFFPLLD